MTDESATIETTESVIYIADLAAYNAGYLRGIYVKPGEFADADELYAHIEAFITGPADRPAGPIMFDSEEWLVHDYIDGPITLLSQQLGETSDMRLVWELVDMFEGNDNDFEPAAWVGWADHEHHGDLRAALDDRDGYTDAACGIFDNESDYAYDYAVETGQYDADAAGKWPYPSIDWDEAWSTLDGFYSIRLPDNTYAIFREV
jgi:hypothetical protein